MNKLASISLPSIFHGAGLEVQRTLEGEKVRDLVVVQAGHSTRDIHVAITRAREQLAHLPELLTNVDVRIDRHSVAAIEAAKAKRERRAARGRGR